MKIQDIKDDAMLGDVLYDLINNDEYGYGISGNLFSDEALEYVFKDLVENHAKEEITAKNIIEHYREISMRDAMRDYGYMTEEEVMEQLDPICLKSGLILVID